jgi:iron complex outermembrane receptor protein
MSAGRRALALFFLLTAAWPAAARAQARCTEPRSNDRNHSARWGPPLGHVISLRLDGVTLKEALERLSQTAGVRLSYNAQLLPSERRVCASWIDVPVGDALTELLQGVPLAPRSLGADQVVLVPAPLRPAQATETPPPGPVVPLEPVVINVDATSAAQRSLAVDMAVLDGRDLVLQGAANPAAAFNGAIPGVWAWQAAPSSFAASYGSLRGTSSFGVSYPKVYIDGIEVANPLLARRLSPETIERIEVIRGPGGTALYGADAISGVTNIITRHDTPESGSPRLQLRTGFGLAASAFAAGTALSQDHMVSMQAGTAAQSLGLNLALGSTGEFIPDGGARYLSADASARYVRSQSLVTGMVRFYAERTGAARSPLLAPFDPAGTPDEQAVMQYTAGVRAFFTPNARWTHSIVVGIDGYGLDGLPAQPDPFASAADSALRAAGAGAFRGTLRISSAARFQLNSATTAALTLAADQSVLGQRGIEPQPSGGGDSAISKPATDRWRSNTGLSAQLNAGMYDRVFLTGGLRFEDAGPYATSVVTLPMLGAAAILAEGPVGLKLRAAYGKGIRWPDASGDLRRWTPASAARLGISPEQQAGIEAGVDLSIGKSLTFQATRFDQTASGLFQQVAGPDTIYSPVHAYHAYGLQNVGEISNRGWELQGALRSGPLSLSGTVGLVDSRVGKLADGYAGDLRVGDRMLSVPKQTVSLTASWLGAGWSTAWTVYRAYDWVNYDRLGLARALAVAPPGTRLEGDTLRAFWRDYDGLTHIRFHASRQLRPGLTLTLSGDNLLNRQVGEPDNVTVLPGRTISLGIRASF